MSLSDLKRVEPGLVYRDEYLVEEDQMGDGGPQDWLLRYLVRVLEWLYHNEQWMITINRNFYHQIIENSEKLIVPDIAVFKGIDIPTGEQPYITSWDMRSGEKKCPPLIIEASSPGTYQSDIDADKKPRIYGLMGVKEYFAYDPNKQPVWARRAGGTRLLGWRYNEKGQPTPIKADAEGWMWSEVLEGWLKPDELYLRMYNRNKELLLTKDQFDEQALKIEEKARRNAEERIQTEIKARQEVEQKLAELQRELEELRRLQGHE